MSTPFAFPRAGNTGFQPCPTHSAVIPPFPTSQIYIPRRGLSTPAARFLWHAPRCPFCPACPACPLCPMSQMSQFVLHARSTSRREATATQISPRARVSDERGALVTRSARNRASLRAHGFLIPGVALPLTRGAAARGPPRSRHRAPRPSPRCHFHACCVTFRVVSRHLPPLTFTRVTPSATVATQLRFLVPEVAVRPLFHPLAAISATLVQPNVLAAADVAAKATAAGFLGL